MNQAALIGHSPAVAGNGIAFDGNNQVMLGSSSVDPLQSVVATITDASGNTINSVSLGSTQAGMTNFVWNGKDASGEIVPPGMYYLGLTGLDAKGGNASPTGYVASPVASVSKGANGDAVLTLLDGRTVDSSAVQQWVS
jgi:flagellar basal-body rod modification protein FlgD